MGIPTIFSFVTISGGSSFSGPNLGGTGSLLLYMIFAPSSFHCLPEYPNYMAIKAQDR